MKRLPANQAAFPRGASPTVRWFERSGLRARPLMGLLLYIAIGGITFVVDAGSFMLLLSGGVFRPIAASIAFAIGLGCHFSLNKYFNFRNFSRRTEAQVRTYLVVAGVCWLSTAIIIEILAGMVGVRPLVAKCAAVGFNIPLGFFGHKYLTFSEGIRAALPARRR